jgi:FkbM family methyltransferase
MYTKLNSTVQVENFVFETDPLDSLGLRSNVPFEPEVVRSLQTLVDPGSTVLDIGANIGYFTAYMSKLVGANGTVHAFEPEPKNFALLQRNIKINNIQNVVFHPFALGDKEVIGSLHLSNFNGGMHRLYDSICCSDSVVEVPVVKLDTLFAPGQVSVIKIDVEGFEPFVLKGAESLIKGQNIKIISEYCPPSILEAGASVTQFIERLIDWGLHAYEPDGSIIDWGDLYSDAQKWDLYGRESLICACKGKSNPEIAAFVEQKRIMLKCKRVFIENLIFRTDL